MLLPLGVSEHASLGSRVKDRMGVGFFEEYNPNLLRFNSTSIARAGQSATSFLQVGVSETEGAKRPITPTLIQRFEARELARLREERSDR